MGNFVPELYANQPIPGTGVRVDFNLTTEDAIQGVFVEITAASTIVTATPTALAGEFQIDVLTFPAKAGATDGDYIVIEDGNGDLWAASLDTTGVSAEPTGAIWTAIPAGQKIHVDISADVTAANVAASVEAGLNGLVGFNAVVTTDDTAADGTMTLTHLIRALVAEPDPHNADDTGVGSITTAQTNAGVDSAVDVTADTITFSNDPDWQTGKAVVLTSTGVAPTGLTSGNTYYVIRASAGVYQFATSLANALAGTDIDITSQGAEGTTITLAATAATNCYLFNTLEKLTDAQLITAITNNEFFDANAVTDDKWMKAQIGLDFSTFTKNVIFIKAGEIFDGYTLPDELLPHITLRIDSTDLKVSNIKVTHRGVK